MNKNEILELWKNDKVKALNIIYYAYLDNSIKNTKELNEIIDLLEKHFKINIKETINGMIKENMKKDRVDIIGATLSGMVILNELIKKLGGNKNV